MANFRKGIMLLSFKGSKVQGFKVKTTSTFPRQSYPFETFKLFNASAVKEPAFYTLNY